MTKLMNPERWKWWKLHAIGAATCIAMTMFVYFAALQPLVRHQVEWDAKTRELAEQRQRAADLAQTLTDMRGQLAVAQDAIAASPLQLQPVSQINQRLARLTTLATDCGLQIDQIQPGEAAVGAWYQTVPIAVAGVGSYRTCAAFLHRLHTTSADVSVWSFDLSRPNPDGDSIASFRVDLAWYATTTLSSAQP